MIENMSALCCNRFDRLLRSLSPVADSIRSALTLRRLPLLLVGALVLFAVLYVTVIATPGPGGTSWRTTTFGSAKDDPGSFIRIVLDSITFAAALFIVA